MKQQPKFHQRRDQSCNLYKSGRSSVFVWYQVVVTVAIYSKVVLLLFVSTPASGFPLKEVPVQESWSSVMMERKKPVYVTE